MKRQAVILWLVACVMLMTACGSSSNDNRIISGDGITPMPSKATEAAASSYAEGTDSVTAALISVDTDKMQIMIKDIFKGDNYVLSYNGGTDVKNMYDNVISMAQLVEGEIIDVTFDTDKKKVKSVYINKDFFRSSNVVGFKASPSNSTITYGSASYVYTENLLVVSDGKVLAPTEIMNRDEVTVRGLDNKIYSVTVDNGHGYLTFSGVDNFVGGMVEIGRSFLYTIEQNMMIVIPEGEYEVTLTNGSLVAKKTVYITKDMTVTMDFEEYAGSASKTGTVEFQILPKDVELFIEGNKVDYSKPVPLEYGSYIINLLSDDYDTYTTRINVNSTYQVEAFDLAKLSVDTNTGNNSSTNSTTASVTTGPTTTTTAATTAATTTATTTTSSATAATTTGSVKVTISEPTGAMVYVDNVYVGTAPVTINKNAGEYVITFKQSGFSTKSYVVDVDSADGEQALSFPAMSEE